MAKFSVESQLISKISELTNNLEIDINKGKESYSRSKLKWAMSKLDPDYNFNYTIKEINDFESKYNIEIDSTEYIAEASNYLFHTKVKSLVVGNAKELFKQITDVNDTGNIDKIIELVEEKIISCHNLKKEDYGREYYDLSYGANRFIHRFEVIWFYNERNRHKLDKLIDPALPPSLDNVENPIIHFSDYPFLGIDIQQWIDFEKAYRLIPLLKEFLSFIKNNKGIFNKFTPRYNIENIFNQHIRFNELFKTAKDCEFFFYYVEKYGIEKKIDWTYIYEIFLINKKFKINNRVNVNYRNLIKLTFGEDLKRLAPKLSDEVYNLNLNTYQNKIKDFDTIINTYKQ